MGVARCGSTLIRSIFEVVGMILRKPAQAVALTPRNDLYGDIPNQDVW
jgi:hypothetical protein